MKVYTDYTLEIYKVDTPILRTLLSSFMLNNTKLLFLTKLLVLSHNIETT